MAKHDLKVNSLIKFNTLLLLSRQKIHGYEIMKELEKSLGVKVSASQTYPFLSLLERRGYIEHTNSDKRDKKEYFFTAEGKKLLQRISARFSAIIDLAIQPRMRMCAHCGCEVYKGGYEEKAKGRLLYFCCRNCAKSYFRP